jgi:hypothetical protein
MTNWWDEREAWVTEAIAMVAAQRQCTHAEAIALLRRRAAAMDADLEAAARVVVDLGNRLGYRDLGPSKTIDTADEAAAVMTDAVSVT